MKSFEDVPAASEQPRWWQDPRARSWVIVGELLFLSGLLHVAIWAIAGGPWEGPVSWRKPILFGFSGGLTAWSLGWVFAMLPRSRWDMFFSHTAAGALLLEVALIDVQRWRGVASHFNRSTLFDSLLYDVMGVLILWVTWIAVMLLRRVFCQPLALSADMRLAVRGGLVALVWSCLLGIWISVHGELQLQAGLSPARYGTAGVPKFAHGAVIHALQYLPLLSWLARRGGIRQRGRLRLMAAATIGTLLLAVYAIGQTLVGRPRVDGSLPLAGLLLGAVVLLGGPFLLSLVGLAWRRGQPTPAGARRG